MSRLENPICARHSLFGAAEKQAHVWPTLPVQPHPTCFDSICRRRHSTSRQFKRALSYASPVPRLQIATHSLGGIVPRQTLRAQASPARRPSVSDERRDRPRPLPGVSKRLLRRPLLLPSSAGPSPQPAQRPVPSPLLWRDRRHLAHVPPPSLSFVLDV